MDYNNNNKKSLLYIAENTLCDRPRSIKAPICSRDKTQLSPSNNKKSRKRQQLQHWGAHIVSPLSSRCKIFQTLFLRYYNPLADSYSHSLQRQRHPSKLENLTWTWSSKRRLIVCYCSAQLYCVLRICVSDYINAEEEDINHWHDNQPRLHSMSLLVKKIFI